MKPPPKLQSLIGVLLMELVTAANGDAAPRLNDVANLRDFFEQFAPEILSTDYGPEKWSLYPAGLLSNETRGPAATCAPRPMATWAA